MKFRAIDPPRTYETGRGEVIRIRDCARIELQPDEQVTFLTDAGGEYDVARKEWGFYATPSLNSRLVNFGLRAALVKNYACRYYVFLVEKGKEAQAARYLASERGALVRWLDNDADLAAAEADSIEFVATAAPPVTCPCGINRLTTVHRYFAPPAGETRLTGVAEYRRELFRCSICSHILSLHAMYERAIYDGQYVDATYGGEDGMRKAFDRINELPSNKSDNTARVRFIQQFTDTYFSKNPSPRSVLDVGAGLCVFLHRMKANGWDCTALDPDPRAAGHAESTVGVKAICGDFMQTEGNFGRYDLVTFNKVLEHVENPIAMLARALPHLVDGGLVYVELPDGEMAAREGYGREEFFIEHFHVFSEASLAILANRAGFDMLLFERLREPSSKYTLRAFLSPRRKAGDIA